VNAIRRTGFILPALIALVGCGPPLDDSRLLMMDEAARMAGTLVQVEGWEGSPAFAVRLKPDERPLVVSQTDARRLDIPAHMLAYVEGANAEVRLLDLDRDVSKDALVLTGSEGAARQAASILDASLRPLGGDRYQLSAPELLDRSAFLEPPQGLREVQPVEHAPAAVRPLFTAPSGMGLDPVDALSLAGVYVGEQTLLVLDAEGGFTLQRGCGDVERGTAYVTGGSISLVTWRAGRSVIKVVEGELVDSSGAHLRPWTEEP
jgi:hypothetical protein